MAGPGGGLPRGGGWRWVTGGRTGSSSRRVWSTRAIGLDVASAWSGPGWIEEAVCCTPVELWAVPLDALAIASRSDPQLIHAMGSVMSAQVRWLTECKRDITTKDVNSRVAHWLLSQAPAGTTGPGGGHAHRAEALDRPPAGHHRRIDVTLAAPHGARGPDRHARLRTGLARRARTAGAGTLPAGGPRRRSLRWRWMAAFGHLVRPLAAKGSAASTPTSWTASAHLKYSLLQRRSNTRPGMT